MRRHVLGDEGGQVVVLHHVPHAVAGQHQELVGRGARAGDDLGEGNHLCVWGGM